MMRRITPLFLCCCLLSAVAWTQPSHPITACGVTYTVTASLKKRPLIGGATWYLLTITAPGKATREIKIGKQDAARSTIIKTLKDSLVQSGLFGTCTDYDAIYDLTGKTVDFISQEWFPDNTLNLAEEQQVIDEDNIFKLVQAKGDKKYQLGFFHIDRVPVTLVHYDYTTNKYVFDQPLNDALILKNFDKVLYLYNKIPSKRKPALFLLQRPDFTYDLVPSEDGETVGPVIVSLSEKVGDKLAGKKQKLKMNGPPPVSVIVYNVNYPADPATSKKTNDAPKFQEN